MKIRRVALVAVLVAGPLMAAPDAARAEGRITITKTTVQSCNSMGKCIWKVSCQVGGQQLVQDLRGVSRDVKEVGKAFDVQTFPVNVQCKTDVDTGFFSTSWQEVGKASVQVPGGGDWDLEMANKDKGGVTVHLTVDSLEVGAPAAAPAAGKTAAKSSKAAAAKSPSAARQFVGVFQAAPQGEAILVGLPWDQFKARADQLDAQSSRIVSLDTYVEGGRRVWSGIFRSSANERQALVVGLEPEAFSKKYKDMVVNQHMRLVDVVVYDEGNKRLLAGAFREGYDNPALWLGQEQNAFAGKVTELGGQGQRLVHMDVYRSTGNKLNYAGAFRQGSGSYGLWTGLDRDAFLARWKKAGESTQINEVKTYTEGRKRLYDAVIGGGGMKTEVELGLDWNALAAKWKENFTKRGMRLVGLETYQD
jgi:hypothetical protein